MAGNAQSSLKNKGYTVERKSGEDGVEARKDEDRFFISWFKIATNQELVAQMEILKETNHCHIVNTENSFTDESRKLYYVVMEKCQGGTLAEKIRRMNEPLKESEALSLIVELCLALKAIQDKDLPHKDLTPEVIFFTEFGTLRLQGFGKIQASAMAGNAAKHEVLNYLPPETLTSATYDEKSAIWSVGCILYELCTKQQAFSADTTVSLISRIISGSDPVPQGEFSSEFLELLSDMLSKNLRPTVQEILRRPIVLECLLTKCKSTTEHLQGQLNKLRCVADDLERVHRGTTIGSLTGGVIGAVGGITSIVGIALAPFTFGASLVVTGIGAGVGLAGGITAGASNIIKATNESSERKAFKSIIKEFEEKINAVTLWFQEIDNSLQMIRERASHDSDDNNVNSEEWAKVGARAARNLSEVGHLIRVGITSKTLAQISRAVHVAGAAGTVFSALFLAADVFFIAMDAKEIHNINQAVAGGETRSEIMKFVKSIREAADELQKVLDEFKSITACIDSAEDVN